MVLLKDLKDIYKCSNCGHKFKGSDIKTLPISTNVSLPRSIMMFYKFVDKDGKVTGGSSPPTATDKTMCCPKCEAVHLFGFDKA